MQNVALTEDIRKLDAEREQLRELAQRKDAALLQMRTALLESEESRNPNQGPVRVGLGGSPTGGMGLEVSVRRLSSSSRL